MKGKIKLNKFRTRSFWFLLVVFNYLITPTISGQPFLHSIAVLFRARPPYPTTFPLILSSTTSSTHNQKSPDNNHEKSQNNHINQGAQAINNRNQKLFIVTPHQNNRHKNPIFFPTTKPQQGILVAHPIPNPGFNNFQNNQNFKYFPQFQASNQHLVHVPNNDNHHINYSPQNSIPKPIIFPNTLPTQEFFEKITTTSTAHPVIFKFPDPPSPPIFQSMSQNEQNFQIISTNIAPTTDLNAYETQNKAPNQWDISYNKNNEETLKKEPNLYSGFHDEENFKNNIGDAERNKKLEFRPSPQLLDTASSFSSGVRTPYSFSSNNFEDNSKLSSSFKANEAKDAPRYESGFKPISYHQYASDYGTTASREIYTNSFTQYFNPWSSSKIGQKSPNSQNSQKNSYDETNSKELRDQNKPVSIVPTTPYKIPSDTVVHSRPVFSKSVHKTAHVQKKKIKTTTTTTEAPIREERKIVSAAMSSSVVTTEQSVESVSSRESFSTSIEKFRNRQKTTPSSSEVIEDWVNSPKKTNNSNSFGGFKTVGKEIFNSKEKKKQKFPVYNKFKDSSLRMRPMKCDKFHRFGFCPVTTHYPLSQVEKIASRCSALLSHLIAPLPNSDMHFDIVVRRGNETSKSSEENSRKSWNWKNYKGKPVCDTEEIKIVPGWAKNEKGEWLVILQTQIWKQEAQVSVCSIEHAQNGQPCRGVFCNSRRINDMGAKCVQRFTPQRLAVLDPLNADACPLIKNVFLPSACVCLAPDSNVSIEKTSSSVEDLRRGGRNLEITLNSSNSKANANVKAAVL